MRNKTPAILAFSLLSLALAGCNDHDADDATAAAPVETAPAPAEEPAPVAEPATPASYTVDKFVVAGEGDKSYLTDSKGRRLYVLEDDDAAVKCVGDCLTTWHAVTGPAPVVDLPDVPPTAISTVTRSDGTTQVTYYGHPLYYYDDGTPEIPPVDVVAEESPWGRWYLVNSAGDIVTLKEGVPTTSSPTAAGADARELPTQSPGGQPGEKH
jgi:predicted lipoprotein with Yx(FWY)xxD motif